jgi:branched-chain amino acid transport system permease protein
MDIWGAVVEAVRQGFGPQAAAYAVAATGLNLHFGHTGLLNFGQVGFLLVGAYGTAITVDGGGSFWLGVVVGCLAAVVLALVLGVPTLRLRADYLAIVTITVAEILRLVVRSQAAESITGGVFGIVQVPGDFFRLNPFPEGRFGIGDFAYSDRALWIMVAGWGLAIVCTLVLRQLIRSPWGRVIRSIREDEDAVRSLGKNVFVAKLQSLAIGGVMGALGGIVLLLIQESVTPDVYIPTVTFFAFTIVILGGAGSTWGPIVGSVIFWTFIELSNGLLREAIDEGLISESVLSPQDVAATRFVIMGVMLALLMVFRPQGILGNKEEVLLDAR